MQFSKGRILQETLARLPRLRVGEAVLLQPYKKDRSVYIILQNNMYLVVERGFDVKEITVEAGKIRKVLKSVCRREFPRSNKIWLKLCNEEEVDIFARK